MSKRSIVVSVLNRFINYKIMVFVFTIEPPKILQKIDTLGNTLLEYTFESCTFHLWVFTEKETIRIIIKKDSHVSTSGERRYTIYGI